MKFQSFDRSSAMALRKELESVLEKYGAESNLEFVFGNTTYSAGAVELKVSVKIAGGVTLKEEKIEKALSMMMQMYNLQQLKNGRKLVGYDTRKPKFPFIYEENGKRFKTSSDHAKVLFAA